MLNARLTPTTLQIDTHGHLRHFLTIEGLPRQILTNILDDADQFIEQGAHLSKKLNLLNGITIANLFFEASTRTRSTFDLAAKRLGADTLNLNLSASSTSKGESLLDTIYNLQAMNCHLFIVRHPQSGVPHLLAQHVPPQVAIINAGDGRHAHPTQAMLDILTIRRHKKDFSKLCIAMIGDIAHSRVARSSIHALSILGAGEIRVIAPKTLIPSHIENLGVQIYHDIKPGLHDVDVIMMLRLQRERMHSAFIPNEQEYHTLFGLTPEKLSYAKPDALVMHPGPTNRGVEIDSAIVDGPASVILQQVTYGIAIRMAIMMRLMKRTPNE